MKTITALTLTTALATLAGPALAQSKGDMTLGLGVGWVDPGSASTTLAAKIGTVQIDPWVVNVAYVLKF